MIWFAIGLGVGALLVSFAALAIARQAEDKADFASQETARLWEELER